MTKKTHEFNTVGEAIAARNERLFAEQAARKGAGKTYAAVKERVKAVKQLKPEEVAAKYSDRRRTGKTERDHKTGAWRQRLENRAARSQK